MSSTLLPVLLAVPLVMLACQIGGRASRYLGQPPVMGEIIVGIMLGPSLLGWIAPDLHQRLLPQAVLPIISALGNLALLAFLFLMGLELRLHSIRASRYAVVGVSLSGILLPAVLGVVLGLAMYQQLAPPGVGRLPFVMFLAIALSITAFPVLARILSDRGLQASELGSFVLACAAVDDAIAWCLITAVVALCTAGTPLTALTAVGLVTVVAVGMFLGRSLLRTLLARAGRSSDDLVLVILCAGAYLSAYATDLIGVHPAFGAFLFGVTVPRRLPIVERGATRLRSVFVPVLLPLFFVSTGLHTDLSTLSFALWGWGLLILVAAVLGKWGGATVAAHTAGSDWRRAATIGTLMNCRGLTELVVLSIGLQIGVLTAQLYGVLVAMAVLTTAATSPVVAWLTRRESESAPDPMAAHDVLAQETAR